MTGARQGAGAGTGAAPAQEREAEALAARWPRDLIERSLAGPLARRWTASRRAALAAGRPPFARHALTPALAAVLFETRRARRLVRGLEAAELALDAQHRGVQAARSAAGDRAVGAPERISRLLLLSEDGAGRFYRNVESLVRKYGVMLEVLVLAADETAVGAAAFGPGQRVRALLVDHKEAVIRVLESLSAFEGGEAGETSEAGGPRS